MNEFDIKAAEWDKNLMHRDRAEAVADAIMKQIPLNRAMTALEFGAGTGLLSFILRDHLREITLIDNSPGMVKVLNEKKEVSKAENLTVLNIDLVNADYSEKRFDLIYTLMVLHHVDDVAGIVRKLYDLLKPGGYLAIADLYTEDGSFHGPGFSGHKGFDPEAMAAILAEKGFSSINHGRVYVISKQISDDMTRQYDVFMMTARRF